MLNTFFSTRFVSVSLVDSDIVKKTSRRRGMPWCPKEARLIQNSKAIGAKKLCADNTDHDAMPRSIGLVSDLCRIAAVRHMANARDTIMMHVAGNRPR